MTGIAIALPGLGLIARGGIFMGKWIINDAIGTPTSEAKSIGNKSAIAKPTLLLKISRR